MILVVIHEFGPYKKGEHITDPAAIAEILATENAPKVVKKAPPLAEPAKA
jgi:hypothetical protein